MKIIPMDIGQVNGYGNMRTVMVLAEAIEDALLFAHDCMNDFRYEEALSVFKLVMDTQFPVEDEVGGDSFELSLEEMEEEGLAGINLKVIALDVLYIEYQLHPSDKRTDILYSYFQYPYFKDIHIEDIFSVGREELKDTDMFFQSWIDFLMQQHSDVAARLLKEGILYYKGAEGFLEEARKGYNEHPGIYLAALLEYEKAHEYEKMKEIGKEALDKLERDLKIRGEIAIKTAQASACVNDDMLIRKCLYEAFYSDSTVINYLRLFADKESTVAYKDDAEKRIGNLQIYDDYHKKWISETYKNTVTETDYKYLCFFSGHFDKVKNWCMEQKSSIGWNGKFIGHGLDLMLLFLYADNNLKKAGKEIADRVSRRIGFNESKNLVFIKENLIFKTEVIEQNSKEIFWNIFCLWKSNYIITKQEMTSYVDWLESVIDMRINGIVGGKDRSKYDDVALLAAALGELKESLGERNAKITVMDKYTKKYSRYTSFKGALRGYMD
jgi:hypothetical protein